MPHADSGSRDNRSGQLAKAIGREGQITLESANVLVTGGAGAIAKG